MVAFLVEVPSKVAVSAATGLVSLDQLASSLQLLVVPPPSQVLVAANVVLGDSKIRQAKPAITVPRSKLKLTRRTTPEL